MTETKKVRVNPKDLLDTKQFYQNQYNGLKIGDGQTVTLALRQVRGIETKIKIKKNNKIKILQ
jgi:hypothetical protein